MMRTLRVVPLDSNSFGPQNYVAPAPKIHALLCWWLMWADLHGFSYRFEVRDVPVTVMPEPPIDPRD